MSCSITRVKKAIATKKLNVPLRRESKKYIIMQFNECHQLSNICQSLINERLPNRLWSHSFNTRLNDKQDWRVIKPPSL